MPDALGMTADEMRSAGYRIVDAVVDHIENISRIPALRSAAVDDLLTACGAGPVPDGGGSLDQAMHTVMTEVLSTMQHGDHPRYFARVPGPSSFTGIAGDWLTSGFNAIASSWGGGAGPTAMELVAIDWVRQLLGLPDPVDGVLLSGGSLANLTALAAALDGRRDVVVYFSDQTHSCVAKALHVLGVPPHCRRMIDTGTEFRLTAAMLSDALDADIAAGHTPGVVVATAGSTNTGAVDELVGLGALAARHRLWLHVDGAYGGPTAMTERGAIALAGLESADSLVLDPHKWLFQPYDIAVLLVRQRGLLERFYAMNPEYLADVLADAAGEVDMRNLGPELTRRARAIKLWMTIAVHGRSGVAAAVQRGVANAELAEAMLIDGGWSMVTPAQLGIVTFTWVGASDDDHRRAAQAVTDSGFAAVTCTQLAGRQVLRLCVINPLTTAADIGETLARLRAAMSVSLTSTE